MAELRTDLGSIDALMKEVRSRPHDGDVERLMLALDKVMGDNSELRYRLAVVKMATDGRVHNVELGS